VAEALTDKASINGRPRFLSGGSSWIAESSAADAPLHKERTTAATTHGRFIMPSFVNPTIAPSAPSRSRGAMIALHGRPSNDRRTP
jgi:hypothetical protein